MTVTEMLGGVPASSASVAHRGGGSEHTSSDLGWGGRGDLTASPERESSIDKGGE